MKTRLRAQKHLYQDQTTTLFDSNSINMMLSIFFTYQGLFSAEANGGKYLRRTLYLVMSFP